MRKSLCAIGWILASGILLGGLSGCGNTQSAPPISEAPLTQGGNTPAETTAFSAWTALDLPGFYAFDDGITTEDTLEITEKNGVLAVTCIHPGLDSCSGTVITYNWKKKTQLGRAELPEGNWKAGQLADGGLYVTDYITGKIRLLDTACKQTGEISLPVQDLSCCQISLDGKQVLYVPQTAPAGIYDVDGKKTVALSQQLYINQILGHDGKAFLFTTVEGALCRANSRGTVVDVQARQSAHLVGPYLVETNEKGYLIRTTTSSSISFFPADAERAYPLAAAEGYLTGSDGDGFRIYDLNKNGSSGTLNPGGTMISMCYTGENAALLLMRQEQTYRILGIHLGELPYTEKISLSEAGESDLNPVIFEEWTGSEQTLATARRILDTYGVRVGFSCATELPFYACVPMSADKIPERLTWIEDYLKLLPEGLTREVGNGKTISIYLCDEINEPGAQGGPAGFATQLAGTPFMALDADGSQPYFTELLTHEFVHLMEWQVPDNWLSQWVALSPGDGYVMSYTKPLTDEYVPYANSKGEVWFYDHYSRTFPEEDRATIGQKLYQSYLDGGLTEVFQQNTHLREKAVLFCRMMRSAYPSCAKAGELYWEKYLDIS